MNQNIIIAIDGPAGSGKSTTARIIAGRLGAIYVDTGAMYRAVTLAALRGGVEASESGILSILDGITIRLEPAELGQRTFLNGEDVSEVIRTPVVTQNVSFVSSIGEVRRRLVALQRGLALNHSIVMDGRDIGTVVFPEAHVKIYMTAAIGTRAQRRAMELEAAGTNSNVDEIARNLEERDRYDSNREESPLRKADDAIEINTSGLSIADQVDEILAIIHTKTHPTV